MKFLNRAQPTAALIVCVKGNYAMPKHADILKASDDIAGARIESIGRMKRTEKILFYEKVCFPGGFGLRSRYIVRWSLE